jgi:hypothetical protein
MLVGPWGIALVRAGLGKGSLGFHASSSLRARSELKVAGKISAFIKLRQDTALQMTIRLYLPLFCHLATGCLLAQRNRAHKGRDG